MTKHFIATVVAAALTITSFSAAPARAEINDVERLLLGLGALAIIGTAIHENQSRKKSNRVAVTRRATDFAPRRAALPQFCLRTVNTYNGDRRLFGARCLRNNYAQFNRLPEQCRRVVTGPRGQRVGYGPRCLRRAGFHAK